MPPKPSDIWDHFYKGEKQNSSQHKAYCYGCIYTHRPAHGSANNVMDVDSEGPGEPIMSEKLKTEPWFSDAVAQTKHVRGDKLAMIAHLIGNNPVLCPHASAVAKKLAKAMKGGKSKDADQTQLKVIKGLNIPFSDAQAAIINTQFLRAIISANLPFRWTVDPEIIKLFLMFRSTATDVIPSDKVISGRLLDEEAEKVDRAVAKILKGRYVTMASDGWKDKYSVTGVDVTVDGKSYLIDLIHTRGKKKDGESMVAAFCGHIDKAEKETGWVVVCYVCDNDGGSQLGRKLLIVQRPWLIGLACCGHQGQLILLDYLKENKHALQSAEDTTDAIGWINNHERVRDIFDEVQAEQNGGTMLAYLMANLTRWTTHSVAFNRFIQLKNPVRNAAIIRRDDIVEAQVGAEKNRKKRAKMEAEANKFCDLLDDPTFWKNLQTVADDIEPICYITNINQSDKTRADQVLLGFAGVYLHFKRHTDPAVAAGMMKRIEKRWSAMDQEFFIITMVLNPYERVSRFGDQAGVNVFTLSAVLMQLYRRVKSRPSEGILTPEQQTDLDAEKEAKETQVSQAFLKYMSIVGVFGDFEGYRAEFQKLHGNNPILVWETMLSHPDIRELADFAMLLLGIAVNQAGNERDFSDFKIKRTRLRNRLSFQKTAKMSKVGASIRTEHVAAGLTKPREKRQNHDDSRVADLIAVPQYADLLEKEEESDGESEERISPRLVNSGAAWRKVYVSWAVAARVEELEAEELSNGNAAGSIPAPPAPNARRGGFLARCLAFLRAPRKAFTQQQLLMELLAAEHSEEEPDDGELEGSGDDYDGDD
ncbi:ribonuclease H-like domain-containing protein [Mycena capillaripes]|nr:ribonuclease H-like domain-containing protein [Mycena capillaripes]